MNFWGWVCSSLGRKAIALFLLINWQPIRLLFFSTWLGRTEELRNIGTKINLSEQDMSNCAITLIQTHSLSWKHAEDASNLLNSHSTATHSWHSAVWCYGARQPQSWLREPSVLYWITASRTASVFLNDWIFCILLKHSTVLLAVDCIWKIHCL